MEVLIYNKDVNNIDPQDMPDGAAIVVLPDHLKRLGEGTYIVAETRYVRENAAMGWFKTKEDALIFAHALSERAFLTDAALTETGVIENGMY